MGREQGRRKPLRLAAENEHIATLEPRFGTQGSLETHGHVGVFGATGDYSGGGDALVGFRTERTS